MLNIKEKYHQRKKKKQFKLCKEWQPFEDVANDIVSLKTGEHVQMLKIEPNNIALLSVQQQMQEIVGLATVLRTLPCNAKVYSLSMPINVDSYQIGWESLAYNQDTERKRSLSSFYYEQARLLGNGQQYTREFYLSICARDVDMLQKYTMQITNECARIGLTTSRVSGTKLIQVYTKFFNSERVKNNESSQLLQVRD
ncbi:MAG: hypothetical protein ACRC17_10085 [Culicoidibacterales bacterium]